MKDRLKKKLKSKKIAKQLKAGKPKIYEMPEEYKRNLQHLTGFLQKRDEAEAAPPLMNAGQKEIAVDAIKKLDENIEIIESKLAVEYEEYQEKMRIEEEISRNIERGSVAVEELYIITKDQVPHLFEEFHKIATQNMTEEEIQEFLDRIAVREAKAAKIPILPPVVE